MSLGRVVELGWGCGAPVEISLWGNEGIHHAVRDEEGSYLGTLEATEDITDLHK